MIATGFQNVVTGEWWPSVFPGLALAITVFGFSLVGSSVEVFGDPVKVRRLVRDVCDRRVTAACDRTRARRRLMRIISFLGQRLLFIVPQLFGILLVSFFLIKSVPGDPAVLMLGPMASRRALPACAPSWASIMRCPSSSCTS